MNFGNKLKKLREERGISQGGLARKLGYSSNSYIADVEKGRFIPSKRKLKKIARVLRIPLRHLNDILLELRIEELGIKDPDFISMFKDCPNLTNKEKKSIIRAYLRVKGKNKRDS